jgi:predicted Fe-Mo cluster-binding NifX family protein
MWKKGENTMKICMPAQGTSGLNELVFEHFGSAPYFAVYDLEAETLQFTENKNEHHSHGSCQPFGAIQALNAEAVLTGGMGARAVSLLNEGGIKVYLMNGNTIAEAVKNFKNGKLTELTVNNACGNHGGGCH